MVPFKSGRISPWCSLDGHLAAIVGVYITCHSVEVFEQQKLSACIIAGFQGAKADGAVFVQIDIHDDGLTERIVGAGGSDTVVLDPGHDGDLVRPFCQDRKFGGKLKSPDHVIIHINPGIREVMRLRTFMGIIGRKCYGIDLQIGGNSLISFKFFA